MSVFTGAIGQVIVLDVGVNISAATTKRIKYEKPDGTTGYWTAAEESSTSISYTTTAASDLNIKGTWKLQAYVVTSSWAKHGEIGRLVVKDPL